jgi:release factor glutamine methyltransferase
VLLKDALASAIDRLTAAHVGSPRLNAEILLMFTLACDRAFLYAHPERQLTDDERVRYDEAINHRYQGVPSQYITGHQEFWGMDLIVSPTVLIPRPETEHLIETVVPLARAVSNPKIVDVGTGSGCIAISILCNVPGSTGLGLDISERALAVARTNSERHHVSDRLQLTQSNVLEAAGSEKFDLVVSNPPYVPANELPTLQVEVRNFEPHIALSDGNDGLSVIRTVVDQAPAHLKKGGFLMMEIGFGQAENVLKMFLPRSWSDVEIIPDLQGIPRTVKAALGDRK